MRKTVLVPHKHPILILLHSLPLQSLLDLSSLHYSQRKDKYDFATDDEIEQRRYERVKRLGKKGYVQLITNMGTLNLELHCDLVPKTAENFIGLCKQGKYNNTIFHRLIKNFMIQGGDPTGRLPRFHFYCYRYRNRWSKYLE